MNFTHEFKDIYYIDKGYCFVCNDLLDEENILLLGIPGLYFGVCGDSCKIELRKLLDYDSLKTARQKIINRIIKRR